MAAVTAVRRRTLGPPRGPARGHTTTPLPPLPICAAGVHRGAADAALRPRRANTVCAPSVLGHKCRQRRHPGPLHPFTPQLCPPARTHPGVRTPLLQLSRTTARLATGRGGWRGQPREGQLARWVRDCSASQPGTADSAAAATCHLWSLCCLPMPPPSSCDPCRLLLAVGDVDTLGQPTAHS